MSLELTSILCAELCLIIIIYKWTSPLVNVLCVLASFALSFPLVNELIRLGYLKLQ